MYLSKRQMHQITLCYAVCVILISAATKLVCPGDDFNILEQILWKTLAEKKQQNLVEVLPKEVAARIPEE